MAPHSTGPKASAANLEPLGRPRSRFSGQHDRSKQDNHPSLHPDQQEPGRMPTQPEDGRHPDGCCYPPPPRPPKYHFGDRIRVEDSPDEPPPHDNDHSSHSTGRGPSAIAANLIKLGPPHSRVSKSYTASELEDTSHDHYDEWNGHDKGRELYNRPAERVLGRGLECYEKPAERGEERRRYVYGQPTHHRREQSPERHEACRVYSHDKFRQRDSHRGRASSFGRGHRGRVASREGGLRYDDSVVRDTISWKRQRSFSPNEHARPAKRSWNSGSGWDRRSLNNELGSHLTLGRFKDGHVGHQNGDYRERSPLRRYNDYERRREASPGRRQGHVRYHNAHGSHGHRKSPGLDRRRNDGLPKPSNHHRKVSSAGKCHTDIPRSFEGRSDRYTSGNHGGTLRRTDLPSASRSYSRRGEEPRRDGRNMNERLERDSHIDRYDERGGRDYRPRASHQLLIVRGRLPL